MYKLQHQHVPCLMSSCGRPGFMESWRVWALSFRCRLLLKCGEKSSEIAGSSGFITRTQNNYMESVLDASRFHLLASTIFPIHKALYGFTRGLKTIKPYGLHTTRACCINETISLSVSLSTLFKVDGRTRALGHLWHRATETRWF